MPDFRRRSIMPELMDTETVEYHDFRTCLAHLAMVNRLTLASRPTMAWLNEATAGLQPETRLSIIDAGSGYGDMLRIIHRWAARRKLRVKLTGVDMNPWSAKAATAATPPEMGIEYVTANLFDYESAEQPDIILSSLFAHHLPDQSLVRFLSWMDGNARLGWFINDLRRSFIAYQLFGAATAVGGWHRFIRHDGMISILRSFVRDDWERLLAEAGIERARVEVTGYFPFRLCVGMRR